MEMNPIRSRCNTIAQHLAWCPAWWDVCGLDPGAPDEENFVLSQNHLKVMSVAYFVSREYEVEDDGEVRQVMSIEDWQNSRPFARVLFDQTTLRSEQRAVGVTSYAGSAYIYIEKNCLDKNGKFLGPADMPSEESCQHWEDGIFDLFTQLNEIIANRRIPQSRQNPEEIRPYPGPILDNSTIRIAREASVSTLNASRMTGIHFLASLEIITKGYM